VKNWCLKTHMPMSIYTHGRWCTDHPHLVWKSCSIYCANSGQHRQKVAPQDRKRTGYTKKVGGWHQGCQTV
jgi:hypothetical protein